ncbi:hypothetical protein AX16_007104, partial [Volvariella volvacea WC 439]
MSLVNAQSSSSESQPPLKRIKATHIPSDDSSGPSSAAISSSTRDQEIYDDLSDLFALPRHSDVSYENLLRILALILSRIVDLDPKLDQAYAELDPARACVAGHQDLIALLRDLATADTYQEDIVAAIRRHPALQPKIRTPYIWTPELTWAASEQHLHLEFITELQHAFLAAKPVIDGFNDPYLNENDKLCVEVMDHYFTTAGPNAPQSRRLCNLSLAVIQSSGMGKTRMIYRVALQRVTFIFNMRETLPRNLFAYPPPNRRVRNFFTDIDTTEDRTKYRYGVFFITLFNKARARLEHLQSNLGTQSLSQMWYEVMEFGKSRDSNEELGFYQEVVSEVEQTTLGTGFHATWTGDTRKRLQEACEAFVSKITQLSTDLDDSRIHCVLAFDEAHTLTALPEYSARKRSNYSILGSLLAEINCQPIFTLFLSTNVYIHTSAAPWYDHSISRIAAPARLLPPFTELPFDIHARGLYDRITKGNRAYPTLSELCTVDVMCAFGRPLWHSLHHNEYVNIIGLAQLKLTAHSVENMDAAQLACVSLRVMLSFDTTWAATRAIESKLVEYYMRAVVAIPQDGEWMQTTTPSEPILAEAAARNLNAGDGGIERVAPEILSRASENGYLALDGRVEVVGRLLWIIAHDLAVKKDYRDNIFPWYSPPVRVTTFLECLLCDWDTVKEMKPVGYADGATLQEAFSNAW